MKSVAVSLIIAFALCAGVAVTTSRADDEPLEALLRAKIVGTWRVQVSLKNCQTGAEIRTFPAMLTFAAGGTLTGTSTVLPPSARGGDFGIWRRNGHGSYSALSEAFLFNNGVWSQRQRITQSIHLADKNTFYSEATTEFFDTAGTLVSSACASAVGTRMQQ